MPSVDVDPTSTSEPRFGAALMLAAQCRVNLHPGPAVMLGTTGSRLALPRLGVRRSAPSIGG